MNNSFPYKIQHANLEDWQEAMAVAWKTFLKYEADDYSQEGIDNFNDFITDTKLYQMFVKGEYQLICAYDQGNIIGFISIRNGNHISLLFVEEAYHRQKIATHLVDYVKQYLRNTIKALLVTVNSSPYAVNFYHQIGFTNVSEEIEKDGIRYTPMELFL